MIFRTKCRFLICVRVQYVEKLRFGRENGDGCCLTGKGKNGNILPMPEWWNGRHRGLKIPWRQLRDGSSPFSGTKTNRQFTQVDWRFVLVLFSFHSSLFTFLLVSVNCLFERKDKREERKEVVKSNSPN